MISIIIPTLNEEYYLPKLLKSIKNQTYRDYEIIVADAGSKDSTLKIAQEQGCIITSGGLPSRGRNEGAKIAKGDPLLFLDADTRLQKRDFFKRAIREFRGRNLDIASCRLLPWQTAKTKDKKYLKIGFDVVSYLMVTFEKIAPFGVGSMILVKKALHQRLGGFAENVKLGEDTLYIRKGAKIGNFGILKSVKIHWSLRRFEKEKWMRPLLSYILAWFLIGLDEKKLDIFAKGIFEYYYGHYKEVPLSPKGNHLTLQKLKEIMTRKII